MDEKKIKNRISKIDRDIKSKMKEIEDIDKETKETIKTINREIVFRQGEKSAWSELLEE